MTQSNNIEDNTILLAGQNNDPEIFYTLEGEGRFMGYPSVFMRLSMCNLTCKGFASPDSPNGCDSYCSWSVKNKLTFKELSTLYKDRGFTQNLIDGAMWKITGGEPLIQQNTLIKWFDYAIKDWEMYTLDTRNTYKYNRPRIDFETNGTIIPSEELMEVIPEATFTVSPKLSNNGDEEGKRFKPEVLNWHVYRNSCFKFVVRNEQDVQEVFDKYLNNDDVVPGELKDWFIRNCVWFMVCAGSQKELIENGTPIAELCKKYCVKFSSRLHLQLWNKAVRA